MEMHVKRRAARSWRQGPIEVQNDLALGVAHSAQSQDLSGMPVPDCHEVIHDCPPLTSAPKKLLAILSLGLQRKRPLEHLARNQFHDQSAARAGFFNAVYLRDVRMVQGCENFRFAKPS